jgi:hypothetical protein
MSEDMKVRVEVWPLAADAAGLWLLSDDAWRSGNVPADDEPHSEISYLLGDHGVIDDTGLVHSTSWRVDGPAVILTYLAVVHTPDLVLDAWPDARPVTDDLMKAVGKPPTHAPTEAPAPRYIDVLLHGLRHLRFLMDADATTASAFDANWRRHLEPLEPELARMYDQHHGAA